MLPKGREGPEGVQSASYRYLDSDDKRRKSYQDLLRFQAQVRINYTEDEECGCGKILCRILQFTVVIGVIALVIYFSILMW